MKTSKQKATILFTILLGFFYVLFIFSNVRYLHTLTLKDPLFYDPIIDTQELRKSVENLKKTQHKLFSSISRKIETGEIENSKKELTVIKDITENTLFPILYLNSLAASVDSNNQFIKSPNIMNAWKLLVTNRETAELYFEQAKNLQTLMRQSIENGGYAERPRNINMFASISNAEQQLQDMLTLEKNGQQLIYDNKKRWWCLFTRLHCNFTEKTGDKKTIAQSAEQKLDTAKNLSTTTAFYSYPNTEVTGPYNIQSQCFPEETTLIYLGVTNSGIFLPKTANENYYYDIQKRAERSGGPERLGHLSDYSLPYYFQPESTSYRCLDLTYWADLSTLSYLEDKLTNPPNSSYELRMLEKRLSDRRFAEHSLVVANKLGQLPAMLISIDSYLDTFTSIFDSHLNTMEPASLLGVRSSYAITYQPFARSIWRIEEKPLYATKGNVTVPDVYTTYTNLKQRYSEAEILQFHNFVKP